MSIQPSPRVLVVGATQERTESICRSLASQPLTCVGAFGASEALDVARRSGVDAAVVEMSAGSRAAVAGLVGGLRAEAGDVGIVMMAPGRGFDGVLDALRLGAVDCLVRTDPHELAAAVEHAIAWSRDARRGLDVTRRIEGELQRRRAITIQALLDVSSRLMLETRLQQLYEPHPARLQAVRRVASIAALIGQTLRVNDALLAQIEHAALLHDIGGLALADLVLEKPGPLAARDRELSRRRTAWTADLLSSVPRFAAVAPVVAAMHEHFDGSGGPDGLSGDAIPVAARVLLVASAFESMAATVPHGGAAVVDHVNAELVHGAGRRFDPAVVGAWLKALDRFGTNIRKVS
jgi:response regulator RpfG family c-di-GMP phosphodiesterase